MSAVAESLAREAPRGDPYDPVLRWMIFTGVSVFAAVVLWRYGLVRLLAVSDRTHISSVIAALYVGASLHCLGAAVALAREAAALEALRGSARLAKLPRGCVGDHGRDLLARAKARGQGTLDQTLLLRTLNERLRRSQSLGALAGDTLIKLGLLGTIIGFILMLGPVASLDADDPVAARGAMAVMSDGMAVAMYTTLAGLVGSILLKAQYLLLEDAARRLFWDLVRLTETRLIPALERGHV